MRVNRGKTKPESHDFRPQVLYFRSRVGIARGVVALYGDAVGKPASVWFFVSKGYTREVGGWTDDGRWHGTRRITSPHFGHFVGCKRPNKLAATAPRGRSRARFPESPKKAVSRQVPKTLAGASRLKFAVRGQHTEDMYVPPARPTKNRGEVIFCPPRRLTTSCLREEAGGP